MATQKRVFVGCAIATASLVGVLALGWLGIKGWTQRSCEYADQTPVPVRLAAVPSLVEAPRLIATEMGYWSDARLIATFVPYPNSAAALQGLLAGEVDIASLSATPVVLASLARDDFCIVAQVKHDGVHAVVARRDRGIETPVSLAGRRVAVALGTTAHCYLDRWLDHHGLCPDEIEVDDLPPERAVEALVEGRVDALCAAFPHPRVAALALGEGSAVTLSNQDVPAMSWVVVVRRDDLAEDHTAAVRYLRALRRGAGQIVRTGPAARRQVIEASGWDEGLFRGLPYGQGLHITLDHELLADLERQARWAIEKGYADATTVPDYAGRICVRPMEIATLRDVSLKAPSPETQP